MYVIRGIGSLRGPAAGFPGSGTLHTDGEDRSSIVSEIQNSGFDLVVAIVPGNDSRNSSATSYYNYHNMSASGFAFGDPQVAVSSRGASASGGDQRICATVAQEVGHYFQDDYRGPSGDPMAQRRNDADGDHAEATETMAEPVRNRILEGIQEYEARLDEPTLKGLLDLVDEMVRRLQLVAEVAG